MKTIATLALAAALAIPAAAAAQSTGTRLPTESTVMDTLNVTGAITDERAPAAGEDPADAAMAELPTVYEDAPAEAETPAAPAAR